MTQNNLENWVMAMEITFNPAVLDIALQAGDVVTIKTQFNRLVRIPGKADDIVRIAEKILKRAEGLPLKENMEFKNAVEGQDGGLGYAFRYGPIENFKAVLEKTTDLSAKVQILDKITRDKAWFDSTDTELVDKVKLLIAAINEIKPESLGHFLVINADSCDSHIFPILFDAVKDKNSRDETLITLSTYNAEQSNINYVLSNHEPSPSTLFAAMQNSIIEGNENPLKMLTEYVKTQELGSELYRKKGRGGLTLLEQLIQKASDGSAYSTNKINSMRDSLILGGAEIPKASQKSIENSMARELIERVKERLPSQTFRADEIGGLEDAFKKVITNNLKLLSQAKANEQTRLPHSRPDGSHAAWTHRAEMKPANEHSLGL